MERLDFYGFLCSGFLMCLYPYIGLLHGLYILWVAPQHVYVYMIGLMVALANLLS